MWQSSKRSDFKCRGRLQQAYHQQLHAYCLAQYKVNGAAFALERKTKEISLCFVSCTCLVWLGVAVHGAVVKYHAS